MSLDVENEIFICLLCGAGFMEGASENPSIIHRQGQPEPVNQDWDNEAFPIDCK